MKVFVYVEGPADKFALETLLRPLIQRKNEESVNILFIVAVSGDRKEFILTKVPQKAVNILRSEPRTIVVALPDLYPKDKAFPHSTFAELKKGILDGFGQALREKRVRDPGLEERFQVFCFKHDLEVLLLAAKEGLQKRLGLPSLATSWCIPVEDQDHDNPPSRVVEGLFEAWGKHYIGQIDAPEILSVVSYEDIADLCPECFKPFVEFLENVSVQPR